MYQLVFVTHQPPKLGLEAGQTCSRARFHPRKLTAGSAPILFVHMPCARLRMTKARGRVAQGPAVMESKSEIPAPIVFLLSHPGFALTPALLLAFAASERLCLQQDTQLRCHRGGSFDFAEQRCSSKNRLSQRTWLPKITIEILLFLTVI